MKNGKNIAKEEVLINIAEKLSGEPKFNFSSEIFKDQLKQDNALEDFRGDLRELQYQQVKRVPTFIIKKGKEGNILTGYRPYESLSEAF